MEASHPRTLDSSTRNHLVSFLVRDLLCISSCVCNTTLFRGLFSIATEMKSFVEFLFIKTRGGRAGGGEKICFKERMLYSMFSYLERKMKSVQRMPCSSTLKK